MKRSIDVILRVAADLTIVNISLLLGAVIRFVLDLTDIPARPVTLEALFNGYWIGWAALLISAFCLLIFSLSGFYSYGRAYRGRYKVLVVAQAVTLAYILFGFASYYLTGQLPVPRGVLFLAWAFNLAGAVGARIWSFAVRWVNTSEATAEPPLSSTSRRVLVIGGAGYIGSAVVKQLLENGWQVRVLDLLLFGTEPLERVGAIEKIDLRRADFRHLEQVIEAMRGVDAVIHLGGLVGDPACALDENLTIDINVIATKMVAEVAKGLGVDRFVFASTCSVYGSSDQILDERSLLNPLSLYARSKIASETVLQRATDRTFAPVILRFSTIYGLSGRTRFDLVVNLMAARAVSNGELSVHGGSQWRPFLHVEDAARAILLALEAPRAVAAGEIFNVGSDRENYSIGDVANIVAEEVPGAKVVSVPNSEDRRNYRVSFEKIHRLLGFDTTWTVRAGVRQVVAAMRNGSVGDYQNPKYSNVAFLQKDTQRPSRPEPTWADELVTRTS